MTEVIAETNGVEISVLPQYDSLHSEPFKNQYIFIYSIRIRNRNPFRIKLLKRHWQIVHQDNRRSEVMGEGVVGETPELDFNESFEYSSWTVINSELGYMKGSYLMQNMEKDSSFFMVEIPRFDLVAPQKLN